ncbi:hypothetical protein [Sporohalobacter salinus]|uniref:hypothetical protein n=1 Tax=Sporohalobacter salinus TaxID=1494606 RepID=UPI001960A6BD|nr:hypothetical protein [Sporohalobacter salinus]MBM7623493.1 hypothetical protein [Sporohalobacter salinus]
MARKVLLGIGILLTVVGLLLIATDGLNLQQTNTKQKMDKEEVITKAKELGMKFPNKLSKEEIKLQAKRVGLKLDSKQEAKKSLSTKSKLNTDSNKTIIEIKNGAVASQVVQKLFDSKIISDKKALLELIRKLNVENKILAGKYEFDSDPSLERVLLKITGNEDR